MAKNNSKKYDTNFAAGGILYHEFKSLQKILLSDNFDELIKNEIEQNRVIGIATNAARKTIIAQIIRRYKCAPNGFWTHFFDWNESEQKLGLFYLCLKTYPLILDIHFEVGLKKYKTGNKLDAYDIQMRMDEIASSDVTVAGWSDSTFKKLNTRYRKAIIDVGLFNGKTLQKPSGVSNIFWNYFENSNESWFLEACFINTY